LHSGVNSRHHGHVIAADVAVQEEVDIPSLLKKRSRRNPSRLSVSHRRIPKITQEVTTCLYCTTTTSYNTTTISAKFRLKYE